MMKRNELACCQLKPCFEYTMPNLLLKMHQYFHSRKYSIAFVCNKRPAVSHIYRLWNKNNTKCNRVCFTLCSESLKCALQ